MCAVLVLLLGVEMEEIENHTEVIKLSPECVDFLQKGLAAEPDKRLSSQEALLHPWLHL